ncbi:MAG TPA: hypothetical protein VMV46_08965 [Thermoanaerobaculia bacterium]|nr:hypothetical protein [Thermoanaerobaculia bacterium]
MSRLVSRWFLILGCGALLACGSGDEAGDGSAVAAGAPVRSAAPRVAEHPSGWSCQRYGDVADQSGDSYDSLAAGRAEEYLAEVVTRVRGERGIETDPDQLDRGRMVGLLSEICMESPDLLLEVAVLRVAEGLP